MPYVRKAPDELISRFRAAFPKDAELIERILEGQNDKVHEIFMRYFKEKAFPSEQEQLFNEWFALPANG